MGKTKEQISYNMSRIKAKDSEIERTLGKALWAAGIRYRKNYKRITGCPDFALVKYKIAIFCDSEFWHGYKWGKKRKEEFKKNKNFWISKIEKNIKRDKTVNKELESLGWHVLRFWGKEITSNTDTCVKKILETKKSLSN